MNNSNTDDDNSDDCSSTESHNTKLRWTNSMAAIHDEQPCTGLTPPLLL